MKLKSLKYKAGITANFFYSQDFIVECCLMYWPVQIPWLWLPRNCSYIQWGISYFCSLIIPHFTLLRLCLSAREADSIVKISTKIKKIFYCHLAISSINILVNLPMYLLLSVAGGSNTPWLRVKGVLLLSC